MTRDDLLTLLDYHHWANTRLLQKAARLMPDQLMAPSRLSHGNALQTLIHAYDAQWAWRVACETGQMPLERLTVAHYPDLPSLRRAWTAEDAALVAYVRSLDDARLDQPLVYSWPRARPRSHTLWHILVQLVHHGIHHRSEVGAYLTTLGHSPGDLDFIIYTARRKSDAPSA